MPPTKFINKEKKLSQEIRATSEIFKCGKISQQWLEYENFFKRHSRIKLLFETELLRVPREYNAVRHIDALGDRASFCRWVECGCIAMQAHRRGRSA